MRGRAYPRTCSRNVAEIFDRSILADGVDLRARLRCARGSERERERERENIVPCCNFREREGKRPLRVFECSLSLRLHFFYEHTVCIQQQQHRCSEQALRRRRRRRRRVDTLSNVIPAVFIFFFNNKN